MNAQEFIEAIKITVVNDSIEGLKSYLTRPPGRDPDKDVKEISGWYNNLSPEDKIMVVKIIKEAVEASAFGFLCVLDGVRAIEDNETKGKLNLYYEKAGSQRLLNDPEEEYLHNLFK